MEGRLRLDAGTWGTMGVGLGYAIAAATCTDRLVVAVEGDSAFGFSGMEVETMVRWALLSFLAGQNRCTLHSEMCVSLSQVCAKVAQLPGDVYTDCSI